MTGKMHKLPAVHRSVYNQSAAHQAGILRLTEVYERLLKDRGFFKDGGGVTISGGEPMAQFDFTCNLAKRLKDSGIHICLDTTGFAATELFAKILPYIDLFLYDIKHMDTKMHKKITGVGNEQILKNARFLAEHGAALQIRVPVIPKLTDKRANLRQTASFAHHWAMP